MAITSHGRISGYFVAAREYAELCRLRKFERRVFRTNALPKIAHGRPFAPSSAPPSAAGSPWVRRFGEHSSGFCSGWMRVRGDRRRRGYDRGFVISDHADWPSLLRTFRETGARRILLTHGHFDTMVRYLREQQVDAAALATEYGAEE